MRKILLAALLFLVPGLALAAPCITVTVNATSTPIFAATGYPSNYLFVDNAGDGCTIYCALCSNNAATYKGGTKLPDTGGWSPAPPIPDCDVACIGSNAGVGCTGAVYACRW